MDNAECHSIDCSIIFLGTKICSVVPRPRLNPACSFLSFATIPLRILSITIFPITLLTTGSNVIQRLYILSDYLFWQRDNQSFPQFNWRSLFSPHYVNDLLAFYVSLEQLCLYVVDTWSFSILQVLYSLLYFGPAGFRCNYFFNLIWSFYFSYAHRAARVLSVMYLIKVVIPALGFALPYLSFSAALCLGLLLLDTLVRE